MVFKENKWLYGSPSMFLVWNTTFICRIFILYLDFEQTTCIITSLDEFWKYAIEVTAFTDKGNSMSETCFNRTEEDGKRSVIYSWYSLNWSWLQTVYMISMVRDIEWHKLISQMRDAILMVFTFSSILRIVWRYQRGNQNP
jgi:hypothetical protein